MATVLQLKKDVERLKAEREATNRSLAEVQADLGKVVDEGKAMQLVALELVKKNRLAQLDGQIGPAVAALAQAEEEEKKLRSEQLLEQIRGILRGLYADVRKVYAELEDGELDRLVREYGNLAHPLHQQRVQNDLEVLRGNLVRVLSEGGYKISRPMGVPPIVSAKPER